MNPRQRESLRAASTFAVKTAQMQELGRTVPITYRFTLTDGTQVVVTAPDLVIASRDLPKRRFEKWQRRGPEDTVSMIQRIEVEP